MEAGAGRSVALESALSALLRERGLAVLANPRSIDEHLKAAVPAEAGRVNLLGVALDSGVVAELARSSGRDSIRESQLAQRLVLECYLSDSDARFAVQTWSRALHEPTPAPSARMAPTAAVPASTPQPHAVVPPAPVPQPHAVAPAPAAPRPATPSTLPAFPDADVWQRARPTPSARPGSAGTLRPRVRTWIWMAMGALLILVLNISQCEDNAPSFGEGESGPSTAAEYAVRNLGYDPAVPVEGDEVVSGLGAAPDATREFVASVIADGSHGDLEWLAAVERGGGTGYVGLEFSEDEETYRLQLAVIRGEDGKYVLKGPLASGASLP